MAGNDIMNSAKFRKYMEKRFGFPQITTTPGPAPITPHEKKDIMGSAPHTAGTEISDESSPAPGTCTEMTAVLEAKRQAMISTLTNTAQGLGPGPPHCYPRTLRREHAKDR